MPSHVFLYKRGPARFATGMQDSEATALLVGLDIGSTTTALLLSESRLAANWVTGRKEFAEHRVRFSPAPVFTPYEGDRIDLPRLSERIQTWLQESGVEAKQIHCCGGILTGLAARSENAREVEAFLKTVFGSSVLVAAQDARLESWVAFMGASRDLSLAVPEAVHLNIDIGGGTSNVAWGKNGEVFSTGSYFIGARPFACDPGSFTLRSISSVGQLLFSRLGISRQIGEALSSLEVARLVEHHVRFLERIVQGDLPFLNHPSAQTFLQAEPSRAITPDIVTLSGGVGELVYEMLGGAHPPSAHFGDLGVEFARGLQLSPVLRPFLEKSAPKERGRATVYGLTIHNVLVSGTTCFVRPEQLPLADLPLVAKSGGEAELARALTTALEFPRGGALVISLNANSAAEIRRVGTFIANHLRTQSAQEQKVLVLLVREDVGKTLGNYASAWGELTHRIFVIDGVRCPEAQMISLGRSVGGVVPVSFFGLL